MVKNNDIIYNYVLAFVALLGYWFATIFNLTGENGWAFQQPIYILIPVLTLYYGTWFFGFSWLYNYLSKKVK